MTRITRDHLHPTGEHIKSTPAEQTLLSVLSWMNDPGVNRYFEIFDNGDNFEALKWAAGLSLQQQEIILAVVDWRAKNRKK